MKKWLGGMFLSLFGMLLLAGCSEIRSEINSDAQSEIDSALDSEDEDDLKIVDGKEIGDGEVELLTSKIDEDENKLEFMTTGIDEDKTVFIYIANEKVFEQKIKNEQNYQVNISDIKDAHRTDYKPRFQLFQFKNNDEEDDIATFKQERYSVEAN